MDQAQPGQCLCGAIRFVATGEPIWTGYCHCQSCRRNTASMVANFVGYRPQQVEFSGDNPAVYQSSPGVRRGFCQQCGTPLYYEADRAENEIHLYVGVMDRPGDFIPQFHVFCAEQVPGFDVRDDLPRHAGTSGRQDTE